MVRVNIDGESDMERLARILISSPTSILYSSPPSFLPAHDMDWHASTMHQVRSRQYEKI